jgi:glycine cleavage system H protein
MALEFPDTLLYQDSHEYVRVEDDDDGVVTIGITAYAIDELGDLVFLELPEVDSALEKGEECGTVESVKAVATIYAPVTGTVLARNDALIESPEQIADDPYGDGWLLRVKVEDLGDLDELLSPEEYRGQLGAA